MYFVCFVIHLQTLLYLLKIYFIRDTSRVTRYRVLLEMETISLNSFECHMNIKRQSC